MKVSFPAMRGNMGGRQYFATVLSLAEIPRLFKFNDWEQCTPELRAQRVLNKSRVPDIANYILNNEDGYLFSSITASYNSEVNFTPAEANPDNGTLEMELENIEFIINDGQHRCAAIAAAELSTGSHSLYGSAGFRRCPLIRCKFGAPLSHICLNKSWAAGKSLFTSSA